MNFMTSEIFYLESCLAIEKSMAEVDEAFAEATQSIDEGFLFESPKDIFETIKQKINAFIEKIKRIFKGQASKAQNAKIDKAGKAKRGAKVQCADGGKVVNLLNKAKAMIAKGKDSEEVCKWFKRGCVALGVIGAAGATYAGVKYAKGKTINAENAGAEASKVDNTTVKESEEIKKDTFKFLSFFNKKVKKGESSDDGKKANGLLKVGSIFSSAMSGVKKSIASGVANAKTKFTRKNKSGQNVNVNEDWGDGADGMSESYDDIFDDDLMAESYDDIFDDDLMLADESVDDYSDIFDDYIGI